MKNYASENAFFKLPFKYDPEALKIDLEKCLTFDFLENYVPANYDGKDYILPLRSINGRLDFAFAVPNQEGSFEDTAVMKACTYFKEITEQFHCEKEAIRLMRLPAGATVNPHKDHECSYEDGFFRIHIPIITHQDVYFYVNNSRLNMEVGEAWYANFSLVHSVENKSTTDRIHLVMDCIRNDWSDNFFDKLGYRFDLENEYEETLDSDTIKLMIRELENQDTEGAKLLLKKLNQQLVAKQ